MATPLTMTNRIQIQYPVQGLNHLWHGYVELSVGGDWTTILDRDGSTLHTLSQCVAAWALAEAEVMPGTPAVTCQVIGQHLTSGAWVPQTFTTVVVTPALGGPMIAASQYTYVLRTGPFSRIHFLLLEGNVHAGLHQGTGYGTGTGLDAVTPFLDGTGAAAHSMFHWQRGRDGASILATGGVAGLTTDLNDKLRRRRGIA